MMGFLQGVAEQCCYVSTVLWNVPSPSQFKDEMAWALNSITHSALQIALSIFKTADQAQRNVFKRDTIEARGFRIFSNFAGLVQLKTFIMAVSKLFFFSEGSVTHKVVVQRQKQIHFRVFWSNPNHRSLLKRRRQGDCRLTSETNIAFYTS